jgi:hypothetical protein
LEFFFDYKESESPVEIEVSVLTSLLAEIVKVANKLTLHLNQKKGTGHLPSNPNVFWTPQESLRDGFKL